MGTDEIREFAVLVAVGSSPSAPVTTDVSFPPRWVRSLRWRIPRGPSGMVGFQVWSGTGQVIPVNPGAWVVGDDEVGEWQPSNTGDGGSWQIVAYNTGNYPHTVHFRFAVDIIRRAEPLPVLYPGAELAPVPSIPAGRPLPERPPWLS